MRGKRSKQYRKLMQQYGLHFGFREPYQVLLDAEILLEAARCRMNFIKMLEQTLHGEVKPMITQCCMRHLYTAQPKNDIVINHAKNFERRRCDHHTLDEPLSTLECLSSVVDSRGSRTNKHRYVVASEDQEVQEFMQSIPGVPIVYILRSVMIMKPMSDITVQSRARDEATKFKMGLKGARNTGGPIATEMRLGEQSEREIVTAEDSEALVQDTSTKKRRRSRPAPNPLAAKPPSKEKTAERARSSKETTGTTRRKRKKVSTAISNASTITTVP